MKFQLLMMKSAQNEKKSQNMNQKKKKKNGSNSDNKIHCKVNSVVRLMYCIEYLVVVFVYSSIYLIYVSQIVACFFLENVHYMGDALNWHIYYIPFVADTEIRRLSDFFSIKIAVTFLEFYPNFRENANF